MLGRRRLSRILSTLRPVRHRQPPPPFGALPPHVTTVIADFDCAAADETTVRKNGLDRAFLH